MKVLCDAPLDCTSLVQGSSDRDKSTTYLYMGAKTKLPGCCVFV